MRQRTSPAAVSGVASKSSLLRQPDRRAWLYEAVRGITRSPTWLAVMNQSQGMGLMINQVMVGGRVFINVPVKDALSVLCEISNRGLYKPKMRYVSAEPETDELALTDDSEKEGLQ